MSRRSIGGSLIALAVAVAVLVAVVPALAAGSRAGASAPATVAAAQTNLGRVLVNSRGRTLYLFARDRAGRSRCSGACAAYWPPLITSGKPIAAAGVKASLVGTTKRADGRLQVTYNHHPLYTFYKDTLKGQTKGQGLDFFGGEWYVLSPAGAKIEKSTTTSSSAPSPGYGGGYGSGYGS